MFDDNFEPLACSSMPYSIIWLRPDDNLFVIVDTIDLSFAQQWSWQAVQSKSGPTRTPKWYARRSTQINGRGGRHTLIWLHKEILLRKKGPPPSKSATIGDHLNGNSLDCRRHNLRWSTSSENRLNLFGSASHQLRLGFKKVMPRHLSTPRYEEQMGMLDD